MDKRWNRPRDGQLRADANAETADVPADKAPAPSADELQNETLRRTQVALDESRDRFADFYELAPFSYMILADSGLIADINTTGSALLGVERAKLLQHRFARFVAAEDVERWHSHFVSVLNQDEKLVCELALELGDGSRVHVRLNSLRLLKKGHSPAVRIVLTDITEDRRVKEELRDLTLNFVSFLENTTDFVYFKDRHGRFRFCSQTMAKVTGHAHWRDLIGKRDQEVFPKDTAQIYYEEELPVLRDGKPLLNKIDPYYDAAGIPAWVSTNKWPLLHDDGTVVGLFGISRDVSLVKQVESALRKNVAFQEVLLEAMPLPVFYKDNVGRYTGCNNAFAAFIGKKKSEIVGKTVFDVSPQNYANVYRDKDLDLLDNQEGFQVYESRVVSADGKTHEVIFHKARMIDDASNPTGIIGVMTDITEVKQAEVDLRIAATAFESHEAMSIHDGEGVILRVNRAFTAHTGYTAQEAVGQTSRLLRSGRHDAAFYAAMWSDVQRLGSWRGEIWNRRKCGEVYPEHLSITSVKDVTGTVTNYVAAFFDITERKLMESIAERERIRLQTILSTASDGIHIVDGEGVLVEANDAFLNMLGYDNSVIGKLRVHEWDAQDPWETIKVRDDDLIRRHGQLVFETRHRRRDGLVLDVEISATGIEIEGKSYIYAASRDITKRKQMELQLRIAAISFESQEGMFITDAAKRILRVNHSFSNISGYTAEEAIGQMPTLFSSGQHDAAFYAEMNESLERSGTWKGEIWNRRKNGEIYPEWLTITAVRNDTEEITNYVSTLSDITLRKATENEIKHLAYYDPLTGLPNRRLLLDRLEQALAANSRRQREGALLFIDLDNFKILNDTLGHIKGDLLLQQVAQRLRDCVRESDTVARLGGDEFVVMLEDLSGNSDEAASQTEIAAVKILAELTLPYKLAEYERHCTASIGISLFAGHCDTAEELLKRADLAMYEAKAAGRNTIRFFDPKMQAVIAVRAAMEADMHEALLKRQFVLFYQAQVAGDHQVIGAEALIRWNHPQRGIVLPTEFIPLAEETGLILPLGQWVLETACTQLAAWATRPEMADFTVAVNVSARQFHQPDFVNQVLAALNGSGANPKRLKLELTESLLLSDVEDVIAKMMALKAKGVSFSLDDFGTGYSSLSYLKKLPLDQLKIDQSFVRDILIDPDDAAIAKMVIALGDSLGLIVIAEGVEIEAQKDFLASLGCHFYQGYLFSRPVPIEAFDEFVKQI